MSWDLVAEGGGGEQSHENIMETAEITLLLQDPSLTGGYDSQGHWVEVADVCLPAPGILE